MRPLILCAECGAPIEHRADLVVGGRMLRSFHVPCYTRYSAAQPWYRKPGWPMNRWRSLAWMNLLMLGLVLLLDRVAPIDRARLPGLLLLLAIINGWQLVGRFISYRSVERHVPACLLRDP